MTRKIILLVGLTLLLIGQFLCASSLEKLAGREGFVAVLGLVASTWGIASIGLFVIMTWGKHNGT